MTTCTQKVVVMKDGPYEIQGQVPLSHQTIVTNGKGESLPSVHRHGAGPGSTRQWAALGSRRDPGGGGRWHHLRGPE